jgi:RimJ/RimL family protein N-acetyltransferase
VALPDASAITVRELVPSDRRALAFAFEHLGQRSRYQRYLSPKPFLSARDISRLLNVDHWHHDALIAYSPPPRAPIGIARYVRLDEFDAAELAIEVVDGWQRRGVGTALLAALQERALRAGIRHFSVSMLRDNAGARALAAHLGRPTAAAAAGSLVELVFDLRYSLSGATSDPAGSSDPADSPPASPPPPSAPTPTGVGAGAGSITVSLTSASEAVSGSPSSLTGQSTITVEPDATCDRRTKSASGSSM